MKVAPQQIGNASVKLAEVGWPVCPHASKQAASADSGYDPDVLEQLAFVKGSQGAKPERGCPEAAARQSKTNTWLAGR